MKKTILTVIFIVFNFSVANCEEKWEAYVDVVHKGIEDSIIAKISPSIDNVKLIDHMAEEKDQINLAENKMKLDILFSNINIGDIVISKETESERNLLKITFQREDEYSQAEVKLSEIAPGIRAVVYNPIIGGGYSFVLALGHSEADVSISAVQEVLQQQQPLMRLQSYFQIASGVGSVAAQ